MSELKKKLSGLKLYTFLWKIKRFLRKKCIAVKKKSNEQLSFYFNVIIPILCDKAFRSKKVFVLMSPDHTNVGDHALAKSETEFLIKNDIKYREIYYSQVCTMYEKDMLGLFNKSKILFTAGGYLGTIWEKSNDIVNCTVRACPKSKIILLPNTVYFENSEYGYKSAELNKKIYNMHSNLFICLRERISYDYAKANYKNVYLFPDMALRLSMKSYDYERIGCLICLRHDIEGTLSKNDTDKLMTNMRQLFADRIDITDMCEEKNFDVKCRSEIIDKKMCEFAKHELVVTDRLHGMIFAAITGTPCIVVDSKSVKLRGCYEWISDLEYIKFCDDLNCIEPFFNSVKDKKFIFDNSKLLPLYEPLVKIIKD